ncbi:hypothetical protein T492DRAFT_856878, partial [Pavlovales sp. CCMP2436]
DAVPATARARVTVEEMIADGRTGGEIATALIEENSLQELKGSIRVMCRVRPPSAAEEACGSELVVQPTNDMVTSIRSYL